MLFLGPIRPGKHVNYVGTGIDVGRDLANRSMVSAEKSYIYEELSDFCESMENLPHHENLPYSCPRRQ